ncbi:hypothetical protein GGI22_005677, partial [Coemansia erecta]
SGDHHDNFCHNNVALCIHKNLNYNNFDDFDDYHINYFNDYYNSDNFNDNIINNLNACYIDIANNIDDNYVLNFNLHRFNHINNNHAIIHVSYTDNVINLIITNIDNNYTNNIITDVDNNRNYNFDADYIFSIDDVYSFRNSQFVGSFTRSADSATRSRSNDCRELVRIAQYLIS